MRGGVGVRSEGRRQLGGSSEALCPRLPPRLDGRLMRIATRPVTGPASDMICLHQGASCPTRCILTILSPVRSVCQPLDDLLLPLLPPLPPSLTLRNSQSDHRLTLPFLRQRSLLDGQRQGCGSDGSRLDRGCRSDAGKDGRDERPVVRDRRELDLLDRT